MNLKPTEKESEKVRHYALKVQQLVEKGWSNECAETINPEYNEIFTRGLRRKLKDCSKTAKNIQCNRTFFSLSYTG